MSTVIETVATVVLLILLMIFISHIIKGDGTDWLKSKFTAASGG